MKSLNMAQQILIACGADELRVVFGGHKRGRMASNTKKGSGRKHPDGKKEDKE